MKIRFFIVILFSITLAFSVLFFKFKDFHLNKQTNIIEEIDSKNLNILTSYIVSVLEEQNENISKLIQNRNDQSLSSQIIYIAISEFNALDKFKITWQKFLHENYKELINADTILNYTNGIIFEKENNYNLFELKTLNEEENITLLISPLKNLNIPKSAKENDLLLLIALKENFLNNYLNIQEEISSKTILLNNNGHNIFNLSKNRPFTQNKIYIPNNFLINLISKKKGGGTWGPNKQFIVFSHIPNTNLSLFKIYSKNLFVVPINWIFIFIIIGIGTILITFFLSFMFTRSYEDSFKKLHYNLINLQKKSFENLNVIDKPKEFKIISSLIFQTKSFLLEKENELKNISNKINTTGKIEKMNAFKQMAFGISQKISPAILATLGNFQLIKSKIALPNDLSNHYNIIEQELRKTKELLDKLAYFAGTEKLTLKNISIAEIIKKVLHNLEYEISSKEIQIEKDFPENMTILAHEVLLTLAFQNIIFNSIESMIHTSEKKINISYKRIEDKIQLIIKDTGEGLNSEQIDRIFEPFYSTKSDDFHIGLGLSTSWGILQIHKINIDVTSEKNVGTSFKFYIPLVISKTTETMPPPSPQKAPPSPQEQPQTSQQIHTENPFENFSQTDIKENPAEDIFPEIPTEIKNLKQANANQDINLNNKNNITTNTNMATNNSHTDINSDNHDSLQEFKLIDQEKSQDAPPNVNDTSIQADQKSSDINSDVNLNPNDNFQVIIRKPKKE